MQSVADAIRVAHGQLDILFANAGGGHATPLADLTEAQIDSELSRSPRYRASTSKASFVTMQTMLGILRNGASVVLNASITADMGLPGFAVYAPVAWEPPRTLAMRSCF